MSPLAINSNQLLRLQLLMSLCTLPGPDPASKEYLTIVEGFNTLRKELGLPGLLLHIYTLRGQQPTNNEQ